MIIGLTTLSSVKKKLKKLEQKKEKTSKKISKLENSVFVINRQKRIDKLEKNKKNIDSDISGTRSEIAELIDNDLLNKASNWLRKKSGAEKKDYSIEYREKKISKNSNEKKDTKKTSDVFKSKLNKDVATPEDIKETQIKAAEHLDTIGEHDAAEIITDSLSKDEIKEGNKQWASVDDVKKLSETNVEIRNELKSIRELMVDEQDSVVKTHDIAKTPKEDVKVKETVKETDNSNWLSNLLGKAGYFLFKLLKTPFKFVKELFKFGLMKRIGKLLSNLGTSAIKHIKDYLKPVISKLTAAYDKVKSLMKSAIEKVKVGIQKVKDVVEKVKGMFTKVKTYVKDLIKKVPNAISGIVPDKLKSMVGLSKEAKSVEKEGVKKISEKVIEKGAEKGIAKELAKAGGKSLLKKIPIAGLIAGIGFGISRAMDGDLEGAGLEVASGAVSMLPFFGTAGSVAIDATLLARDLNGDSNVDNSNIDTTQIVQSEDNDVTKSIKTPNYNDTTQIVQSEDNDVTKSISKTPYNKSISKVSKTSESKLNKPVLEESPRLSRNKIENSIVYDNTDEETVAFYTKKINQYKSDINLNEKRLNESDDNYKKSIESRIEALKEIVKTYEDNIKDIKAKNSSIESNKDSREIEINDKSMSLNNNTKQFNRVIDLSQPLYNNSAVSINTQEEKSYSISALFKD